MKKNILIFSGLFVLSALFFLQFPLRHCLGGNLDSIANLAMYKQVVLLLEEIFRGTEHGQLCYPVENVWMLFGADFGAGTPHILFTLLGIPDLWAYWLFISTLFALNAFSLYLLLRIYFKDVLVSIAGAIIFCYSHFTLANLDNPNILPFFLFFLSLYFFLRYIEAGNKKSRKYLYVSAILGALLIYVSPYLFIYHFIVYSIFILYFEGSRILKGKHRPYLIHVLIYTLLVLPYFNFFILGSEVRDYYNLIAEEDKVFLLSLNLDDIFRVLPNHLYLKSELIYENPLISQIRSAYLGLVFLLMSAFGAMLIRDRILWVSLIVIGFIMALGPYVCFNNEMLFPSFMFPFYEYLNFDDFLRVPVRAFFICTIALTFLVCRALLYMKEKYSARGIWAIPVLLILLENIPFPMQAYNQESVLQPDNELMEQLHTGEIEVVLHIPSKLFDYWNDRREYIYMYWQSFHKHNIVNGNLAFIPPLRMQLDQRLNNIQDQASFRELLLDYNINKVIFHKDQVLRPEEWQLLELMEQAHYLEPTMSNDRSVLFTFESEVD